MYVYKYEYVDIYIYILHIYKCIYIYIYIYKARSIHSKESWQIFFSVKNCLLLEVVVVAPVVAVEVFPGAAINNKGKCRIKDISSDF